VGASMEVWLGLAVLVLVFATYVLLGKMGVTDRGNNQPGEAAYNLLARGFMAGHLYIDEDAPALLKALPDPYDPEANRPFRVDPRYRLHDLSYYRGHLYLYFGAAPALFVFAPWHLLTSGWLEHWVAVAFLCSAGLLVNFSLVRAVKAREFPGAPPWIMAVEVLLLGFGSYAPLLLARADLYEVPIAFCYLSVSIALRCLWEALGVPGNSARWMAGASAAFGAAFAARPTVLPSAAVLLLPLLTGGVRGSARAWLAAVAPLGLCGAAVALYNTERFGSPFDFGVRYQMAGDYVAKLELFSPRYVWTNLGFYLFKGVEWNAVFPFAHEPPQPPVPLHHGGVEHIAGALLNAPILWIGLALPLVVGFGRDRRRMQQLCLAIAWVALSALLTLSFFFGACSRYQFEFVPEMALLGALGLLAVESAGPLRVLARCGWIPALAVSSVVPVLYGVDRCVLDHSESGFGYLQSGDIAAASRDFETARALSPANSSSRLGAGFILVTQHRLPEARAVFEALIRDFPDHAMAHFFLGNVLAEQGLNELALGEYATAHRLDPGNDTIQLGLDEATARRR
jgi:tetratricopeptide (TPR) repeat protein